MDSSTRTDTSDGRSKLCKRDWESFLPNRHLRVLLVEDDDATRQVVCALLCKCGYEVNPVSDGLKAWDLMESSDDPFDLVLTDDAMPLLSGTDLLAKIMISEAHKDIPVIMMSARDSLDLVFKSLLRGAKDFLVKPLRKNELRNLWQHVWRKNYVPTRIGRGSAALGKRRKAERISASGDVDSLSTDDISQSSDKTARSQSDKGSATQDLWKDPAATENDLLAPPEGDVQPGPTKYVSQFEHVNEWRSSFSGEMKTDQLCLNCKAPGEQLTISPQQCIVMSEGCESSERSSKAIDLIGTMTMESKPWKDIWKAEDKELIHGMSESLAEQDFLHESQQLSPLPALELTLKRPSPIEDAWCGSGAKKSLKQSNCSAFSRYTSSALFQQRQNIATVASLSNNQCPLADVLRSSNGSKTTTANATSSTCVTINETTAVMESCSSATLYFPRAAPFQQDRHDGSSACIIASCRDHDETDHKANLQCPSPQLLNLSFPHSSLLSKGPPSIDTDQDCIHDMQKQHQSGASSGPVWFPWKSKGCKNENFHDSSDQFEYNSGVHRHCHPQSSPSGFKLIVSSLGEEAFSRKVLQSTTSEIESATSGRYLSGCSNVSGSGSKTGSNDGNALLSCHQRGQAGKVVPTKESCSFNDLAKIDETRVANCHGAVISDAEIQCVEQVLDFSRSTLREAALNKFRQKRKVRCFEKKVRYQSRKKLAEQRPRVKGQFVCQAVYDASLCTLEQDMACS